MSLSFARFGKYAAILFAAVSAACTQSEIDDIVTVSGNGEAHAVVFDFVAADFAGAPVTRSGGPGNAGFAFENGATIHVLAEFQKEDAYGGQTIGAYECFQYNATSKTWAPLTDADADVEIAHMVWPLHTKSAKFTAFYVPESKNMFAFTGGGDTDQTAAFPLSDIGSKNSDGFTIGDPLIATVDEVKYDGKVRLMFKHACTRLVLTDLRGSQDETYCLVRRNNDINNAYRLQITRTQNSDGGYLYTGKFVWDKDYESCTTQGSLHYVMSKLNTTTDVADAENDPINNWLCFYLEPGKYYGSSVIYLDETPCMTLEVDKLGGGDDLTADGLKENTSYTIDIRRADGIIDDELVEPEDEWAPAEGKSVPVDPKKFLDALYQGYEYKEGETPILT